jgi:hypothetical protein
MSERTALLTAIRAAFERGEIDEGDYTQETVCSWANRQRYPTCPVPPGWYRDMTPTDQSAPEDTGPAMTKDVDAVIENVRGISS